MVWKLSNFSRGSRFHRKKAERLGNPELVEEEVMLIALREPLISTAKEVVQALANSERCVFYMRMSEYMFFLAI